MIVGPTKIYRTIIGKTQNPFASMSMDDFSNALNEIADSVDTAEVATA